MKKILLDCGCHYGKGLRKQIEINKIDPSWKIYCWEANPYTYQHFLTIDRFKHLDITVYHSAVSNENGTIKFNIQSSTDRNGGSSKSGTGSSLMSLSEWKCKGGEFIEEVEVPRIDLSEWVLENINPDDFVILKMDIEGAEYDVLEKIIEKNVINLIDKLYIEWHSHMFSSPEIYRAREQKIIYKFVENKIPVENW
jgi:FkbM family methyltransferase